MANKKRTASNKKVASGLFKPVSADAMLKTIVLIMTLLVAAVAVIFKVDEPAIWTFLGFIAGHAALNNNVSLR